jgi:FtsP/CotA-like multicopper oxidase with cupredoxin domain
VPDPATVGPDIVVVGNEAGFLPGPAVIPSTPVGYEMNRRSITVLNVLTHGVFMGPAERIDAVIDFSKYAGKTLILYNDSPAPVPAFDPRIDYFTGNGDQTSGGGSENTKPGYGPNTRTIMQIKVSAAAPAPAFNVAALQAALPPAYAQAQNPPVVGESAYNAAFGTNYIDTYAKIRTGSGQQTDFIWTPAGTPQTLASVTVTDGGVGYLQAPNVIISGGGGSGAVAHAVLDSSLGRVASVVIDNPGTGFTSAPSIVFQSQPSGGVGASASVHTSATMVRTVQSKAIQELFDPNYGRMNATLGIELPFTTALTQTTIPLGYVDPPTEYIGDGETQIWKITHNGVDTHPVHFHLMNVQLINRVGWDGTIKPPSASELGWKETIKMHPLEDIIIAVSPKTPKVPFGVPESARYRDPSQVAGGSAGFTQVEFNQASPNFGLTVPAGTVTNQIEQYGWEYVWHCHILGHEENDFMRPLVFNFGALPPDAPTALAVTNAGVLTWTDATPATDPLTMLSKKNEIGFRVERVAGPPAPAAAPTTGFAAISTTLANATTYTDASVVTGTSYWYRVVAYNAKGEAVSTPVSMTATSAGPDAAPTLLVATAISSTVVNLTWKDNSSNEAGFVVQRCVADATGVCTGALTTLTTTVANVQSYSDATAAPNTTYVYQVFARNAAGDSAPVKSNIVTTLVAPANAPSNVQAVATSDTQVSLSWTDKSSNEAGFLVQRSANGGATWVDVLSVPALSPVPQNGGGTANITVAANAVAFVDTGLVQHTTYLYRVGSVTSGGVATSMPVTVTTNYAAAPAVGPVTGTALWNQVTLSWPAAAPVTSFTINRTGGAVAATFTAAVGATSFVDTSVIQNTAYVYTVTAVNGPNVGAPSIAASITTPYAPAPAMPGFGAVANSTTAVALSWLPQSATAYVTGLRIMRCVQSAANFNCTSPSSVFTQVYSFDGTTLPTTWVDTGVLASTGYTYQAFFVNGTQNGIASTANVSIPASFAVGAPTALTATLNNTRIGLSWIDGSTNETAFYVERSTDGINFSQVGTVASATGTGSNRTFNDAAIAPGVAYMYRVKAVNVTGAMTTSSAYAGPAVVDMTIGAPNALTATVSATQVALSWRDNSTNETAFVVHRSADGGVTWVQAGTAAALAGNTGTRTFNDNALVLIPGQTYTYYVTARWTFNAVNYESAQSGQVQAKIADLPAPTNLSATMNATAVALSWTDNAANETRFWVDRSADGGVTWAQVGAPAARNGTGNVNFSDTTVTAGNSYSYRVKAENVTGAVVTPSAWSNTVSAHFALPAAPATVTAAPGATAGRVAITWTDSADNETGYTIQRRNAPTTGTSNPTWGNAGTVGANVTTWTDTGRTSGRGYQYQVRANNGLGNSAWVGSVPATVTAP